MSATLLRKEDQRLITGTGAFTADPLESGSTKPSSKRAPAPSGALVSMTEPLTLNNARPATRTETPSGSRSSSASAPNAGRANAAKPTTASDCGKRGRKRNGSGRQVMA